MKRLPVTLFFLAIALSLTSFTLPSPSLVGQWKGEDDGEVGIISFDKEGYVSFTVNGEKIGGKEYTAEGLVFDMYYESDESVQPHKMDFVIKMHAGEMEVARMQGIYTFRDDNTLVINMKFDGSDRPVTLDNDSDDQITLTRMSEKKGKKKKVKSE
jgi:hypothetical protein